MSSPTIDLDMMLDRFRREVERRRSPAARRAGLAAVEVLRNYLVDYAGLGTAGELGAAEVRDLLLNSVLRDPDATPDAAREVAATLAEFAAWAARQPDFQVAEGVPPLIERLGGDVPRMLTVSQALRQLMAEDGQPGGALEVTDEAGALLGSLTAGMARVLRPGRIDYTRSEEDWFLVERIQGAQLWLQSITGRHLGEGPRGPVPVPPEAVAGLRPGDALLVEIAPAGDHWELLNLLGACPGGYGWPPEG